MPQRRERYLTGRRDILAAAGALGLAMMARPARADTDLLNASFDPTRELYRDIDTAFAADWLRRTGAHLAVRTSNGGSGAQARSVLDGQPADVVTLALAADIDMLAAAGLLPADWAQRLPNHATPFTSTIVFLVRKGNPKAIHDWPDLVRPGVQVITPNPKTSGGARWNYLAAWAWASRQPGGTPASSAAATADTADTGATAWLKRLYAQVPVLDTGARGATNTFLQRGIGDVLIAWEDEALLATTTLAPGQVELVRPSLSIRAEPPVAVVTRNAQAHGTLRAAQGFVDYLFTPPAQQMAAQHFFRPTDAATLARFAAQFPAMRMVDIASLGGWPSVQATHFADGGLFDRLLPH